MNPLSELITFKNELGLDFIKESEQDLFIGKQQAALKVHHYFAVDIALEDLDKLTLTRCEHAPFFKWNTAQTSSFGFGNIYDLLSAGHSDDSLIAALSEHPQVPLFHSFKFSAGQRLNKKTFNADPKKDPWLQWSFPEIVIPQVFIEFQKDQSHNLKLTVITPQQGSGQLSFKQLGPLLAPPEFTAESSGVTDRESKAWNERSNKALHQIEDADTPLTKVVLARMKEVESKSDLNPLQLFHYLSKQYNHTPTTHFYLESGGMSFTGFSPENLLKRDQAQISIDAIAGTRSRSSDPVQDRALEQELISCAKEQAEHLAVIDAIRDYTKSLGHLNCGDQQVLKLSNVQHLKTPLSLKLESNDRYSIYKLAMLLHPTPAVGGTPRIDARELISELEDFERGLYAGVIGLQSQSTDQFTVAIRSYLCLGNSEFKLFAGAGIVKDSIAHNEWKELDTKFNSFFPQKLTSDVGPSNEQ